MSLNDTAAVEVMEWKRHPDGDAWMDGELFAGSDINKPFCPDSTYTDAMLVRDKAVERYAEWEGIELIKGMTAKGSAMVEFASCLYEEVGADGCRWDHVFLMFATPAQITEASIALVRRMK